MVLQMDDPRLGTIISSGFDGDIVIADGGVDMIDDDV